MKLGDRIKQKRAENNLSQSDLADLCGWENGRARVSNYEQNIREPGTDDIIKIANALKVDAGWLQFGEASSSLSEVKNQQKPTRNYRVYPLLTPDEVISWLLEYKLPTTRSVEMLPSITEASEKSFNIDITDDASSAVFTLNRTFFRRLTALIDPDVKPDSNSIVWVQINEGDYKLRQYIKDGSDIYLKAFEPQYPLIKFENDMKILGTMVCLNQDMINKGM